MCTPMSFTGSKKIGSYVSTMSSRLIEKKQHPKIISYVYQHLNFWKFHTAKTSIQNFINYVYQHLNFWKYNLAR